MTTKSLQDKSIIVTGAGRGIGREIALLCAAEGAKVVVNDPGVAADGSGTSAAPAEEVVEEIKKNGGTAIANFETVAEAIPASKIVKMATDHFGKLDGVVNNSDRDRGGESARQEDPADGPGKDRAGVRLPAQRRRQGRHRADFCGADERDLPDEPIASATLGASRRRLDAANHRRTRHAGAE